MINLLNSFAEVWMEYFGYTILQNTLFLAVIFLALYYLRDKSAGIQYAVAALGLIKLLIPPFVPITIREAATAASSVGSVEVGEISVSAVNSAASSPSLSIGAILMLIWISTICLMLISSLISTLKLKIHLRSAQFISRNTVDGTEVDIYQSENISVPMSIGLFPKRVYVPELWDSLSSELKHSLLRHEVAHIKRRDGLFGALQTLAQALYFFHPLVWMLTRKANELREMACDDMAVEDSQVTPLVYSRCLVHVAEHMLPSWSCSSASTLIKQKNKLYTRVNYQVKENPMKNSSKNKSRLIWTLLLVLIVPLSWYCKQPDARVGVNDKNTGKLYGKVINTDTGEPIVGANIIIFDTKLGAASNEKGEYFVSNIEPGRHSIRCSVIGYSEVVMNNVKVVKNKSTKLNFQLKMSSINTEKVVVTSGKKMIKKVVKKELPKEYNGPDKFTAYDTPPEPIGGFSSMLSHLNYPESAKILGVEGQVVISIYIDEKGKVVQYRIQKHFTPSEVAEKDNNNAKALQTAYDDCEKEAVVALFKSEWKPALQNDKPVDVWVTVPVKFKLQDAKAPVEFIAYDTPPLPIGGQKAIAKSIIYPEKAKDAGIEGQVVVQTKIGVDGLVKETKILRGIPNTGLNKAAINAVNAVKFHPAQKDGKDVAVWVTLPITFKLSETKPEKNFVAYDQAPEPVGGMGSIAKFIVYPEKAKEAGMEGTVLVQAKVGTDGNVENAKVLKGVPNSGFDKAAVNAIKQVKFHPAKQRDKEIAVWITIPVEFRLDEENSE